MLFSILNRLDEQPFKKQYVSLRKLRLVVSKKQSFKKQPSKKQLQFFFCLQYKMVNLSLKLIAKNRDIKGYKSMSEERLLRSLNELGPVKES